MAHGIKVSLSTSYKALVSTPLPAFFASVLVPFSLFIYLFFAPDTGGCWVIWGSLISQSCSWLGALVCVMSLFGKPLALSCWSISTAYEDKDKYYWSFQWRKRIKPLKKVVPRTGREPWHKQVWTRLWWYYSPGEFHYVVVARSQADPDLKLISVTT